MHNQRPIALNSAIGEQVKTKKHWKHSNMHRNTYNKPNR